MKTGKRLISLQAKRDCSVTEIFASADEDIDTNLKVWMGAFSPSWLRRWLHADADWEGFHFLQAVNGKLRRMANGQWAH